MERREQVIKGNKVHLRPSSSRQQMKKKSNNKEIKNDTNYQEEENDFKPKVKKKNWPKSQLDLDRYQPYETHNFYWEKQLPPQMHLQPLEVLPKEDNYNYYVNDNNSQRNPSIRKDILSREEIKNNKNSKNRPRTNPSPTNPNFKNNFLTPQGNKNNNKRLSIENYDYHGEFYENKYFKLKNGNFSKKPKKKLLMMAKTPQPRWGCYKLSEFIKDSARKVMSLNSLNKFERESFRDLSHFQHMTSLRGIFTTQELFSTDFQFSPEDKNLMFRPIIKSLAGTSGSTTYFESVFEEQAGKSRGWDNYRNVKDKTRSQYKIMVQPESFRPLDGHSNSLRQLESLRRLKRYKKQNVPSMDSFDNFDRPLRVLKAREFDGIDEIELEGEDDEYGELQKAEIL